MYGGSHTLVYIGGCLRGSRRATCLESIVFVIDDDASVRASLNSLFESVGFPVQLYGSADEFLQSERPNVPC
jgi:FixJ family two-component response regulator